MATGVFIVELAGPGQQTTHHNKEVVEVLGRTPGGDQSATLILRAKAGSQPANLLLKQQGDRVIVSGKLTIWEDDEFMSIRPMTLSPATEGQYINELTVVGRFTNKVKISSTGKSVSRTVVRNEYQRLPDGQLEGGKPFKDVPQWYSIRCFGEIGNSMRERVSNTDKGALVSTSGMLTMNTNAEGKCFYEVKARSLEVHAKSRSNTIAINPAAGLSDVTGYAPEDFISDPDDEAPSDWPAPIATPPTQLHAAAS